MWFALGLVGAILTALLLYVMALCGPWKEGLVAYDVLPDGTQVLVEQRHNDYIEPFTVGFYFRRRGEVDWSWCYLDHEDTAWFSAEFHYDPATEIVQVLKSDTLRLEVNLAKNETRGPWPTASWHKIDPALSAGATPVFMDQVAHDPR